MMRVVALAFCIALVQGDVYMHMMRGSNNRLKAAGENVENNNRLFNSQNNNAGGYNTGAGTRYEGYYVGSELLLEWTAQHGCNDPKDECQIVLQYMCDQEGKEYAVRDGTTEETPPENADGGVNFGQHEPLSYYQSCKARQRNQGLFTADRRRFLDGQFYHAQFTRQNENGNRRGYECQEERDYYPYWHPTPWRDIAVLVDENRYSQMCPYYESQSENVKGRGYCTVPQHNNQAACEEGRFYYPQDQVQMQRDRELSRAIADQTFWALRLAQGEAGALEKLTAATNQIQAAREYINQQKQLRKGVWKTSAPLDTTAAHRLRCRKINPSNATTTSAVYPTHSIPTTRVNHLGNSHTGQALSYLWRIPNVVSGACVLRLRYNMSSSDYYSWRTWSEANGEKSPIFQNMHVPVGMYGKVELAINTHQIARTFQDRSHTFRILSVPSELGTIAGTAGSNDRSPRIVNLNVRGKRGNIVQAYPSVEYDYHPNRLVICPGDYVHFQWTGSDTNPRNYAGQGTAGTDRTNIVQIGKRSDQNGLDWVDMNMQMNTPLPMKDVTMFPNKDGVNDEEVTTIFALLRQTDDLLNNANAYFNHPPIQYNKGDQTYHYMCTRNNNFSNRSQKGFIRVLPANDPQCAKKSDATTLPELHPGAVMADLSGDYSKYQ